MYGTTQIIMAVAYMAILVIVGLMVSRKVKTSDDYWVGGRNVGPWATALSYCAAYLSTATIIGSIPKHYDFGLGYGGFNLLSSLVFCAALIFFVFAPKMRALSERLQVVSMSGFLSVRYQSNRLRLICGALVAVMMIPYAISACKGIANAMASILGFSYNTSVIIIAVVAFLYLITSGFWGVSTTDLIQGITISVSVVVAAVIVLNKAGGLTNVVNYLAETAPHKVTWNSGMTFLTLFSYAGVWAFIAFGQPQLITKFMGLKDSRTVGTVVRVSYVWNFVAMMCLQVIAWSANFLYQNRTFADGDSIAPTVIAEHCGSLVAGLFMCGVLAAGLSTVVSLVLTSASSVAKDIYEDFVGNTRGKTVDPKKSILISRVVTGIVMVVVAVGTMYPPDFVWELSTMSAGAMGAAFTAPLILGLYWKRATRQGCYAAVIVGVITSIVWYLAGLTSIVHSFVPGIVVSFIMLVVVSLCTKPMDQDIVDVLFEPGCPRAKIAAAIEGGKRN